MTNKSFTRTWGRGCSSSVQVSGTRYRTGTRVVRRAGSDDGFPRDRGRVRFLQTKEPRARLGVEPACCRG